MATQTFFDRGVVENARELDSLRENDPEAADKLEAAIAEETKNKKEAALDPEDDEYGVVVNPDTSERYYPFQLKQNEPSAFEPKHVDTPGLREHLARNPLKRGLNAKCASDSGSDTESELEDSAPKLRRTDTIGCAKFKLKRELSGCALKRILAYASDGATSEDEVYPDMIPPQKRS
jgi:hypothetical protein